MWRFGGNIGNETEEMTKEITDEVYKRLRNSDKIET